MLRRPGNKLMTGLFCLFLATQTQARNFQKVGVTKGLEARVVVSMTLDQQGYLWVGSREGLFRYDGYETRAYLHNATIPGTISDNDIRYVFRADNGDIWIGTNTGGLNHYDIAKDSFTQYRHKSGNSNSILDDSVYGIGQDTEGWIWAATQKGLSRLNPETEEFEHFSHQDDDPGSLSHNWAFNIHRGASGSLWISTVGGGLNRWNPQSRDFTRYDLVKMSGGQAERNDAFPLYETADGHVWVGTREGLVQVDPATETARYIDMGKNQGYLPVITAIVADNQKHLWLGTMTRGVLIVDQETGEWTKAVPVPLGEAGNLPDQPQMSLAITADQIFVGTWGSGVYRAPLNESEFRLLNHASAGETLRNSTITSVLATEQPGRPWIGSFGGGPQRADVSTGTVQEGRTEESKLGLSGVLDLAGDHNGHLFAATNYGLFQFDETGLELAHQENDPDNPHSIGKGYVSVLLPDGDKGMWVGVMGSGLHFRDALTGDFTVYRHDPPLAESVSDDFITALLDEAPGKIWVGTRSNGLNLCQKDPWSCDHFTKAELGDSALGHHHVTALYRDRRGRVWVGTDGGGLNQVVRDKTGKVTGFAQWGTDHGLLSDGIMAIEEDLDESLWLSTRQGLSRVNPATRQVINFVTQSGLPISHYNNNASDADEAYIYFGSADGLLSFKKGSLLKERTPAPVHITNMQTVSRGEQSSNFTQSYADQPDKIAYGDIIMMQFATLDYSETTHDYAYRLDPHDNWTSLGSQRQIILHGLSPGKYQFQARGRDVFGLWGESEPLSFEIVPPFWLTAWFRLLVVLAILLASLGLHFARANRIQRHAREIQRLSEKRETALEQALGNEAELAVLTPRQKEILQLIAEGYSSREIAGLLDVSIKTVEAHRANLMERLDIHDVPGLVRLAIRSRLVSPHD